MIWLLGGVEGRAILPCVLLSSKNLFTHGLDEAGVKILKEGLKIMKEKNYNPLNQSRTESDRLNALPENYRCLGAETANSMEKLGKKTLLAFQAIWRKQERKLVDEIHVLSEYLGAVKDRTTEDFRNLAKGYKSPTLERADDEVSTYSGHMPYTSDEEAKKLNYGDTTFNLCGWCRYAQRGRYFPTCSPENWCRLSRDGFYQSTVRAFDAPCQFLEKGDSFIEEVAQKIKAEKSTLLQQRNLVIGHIKTLRTALKMADQEIPILNSLRQNDHFHIGDRVMFYAYDMPRWNICVRPEQRNKFLVGRVAKINEHGWLTLRFEEPVLAKSQHEKVEQYDSYSVEVHPRQTGVMLEMEYSYFQTHREEFLSWLHYDVLYGDGSNINLIVPMVKTMLL